MNHENLHLTFRQHVTGIVTICGAWLFAMGYYWGFIVLCDVGYVIGVSGLALYWMNKFTSQALQSLKKDGGA